MIERGGQSARCGHDYFEVHSLLMILVHDQKVDRELQPVLGPG